MKHVVTVVGARPQFVKAAVVSAALAKAGIHEELIHTGQHYDFKMSEVFWRDLGLKQPEVNLGIGSGSHATQTAAMLVAIEKFLLAASPKPDGVIVYGDTNSTLAAALAASKLHIPVVHVEAGLRSFNMQMPEEVNRIITDRLSDVLFCSSNDHLKREGISDGVHITGDVMYDAVKTFSPIAEQKVTLSSLVPFESGGYHLATIHRPSNTNTPAHMESILSAIGACGTPVVWPVHPRNKAKLANYTLPDNLTTMEPASYFEMLVLLGNCRKVLTDSGGLQKEAYWLGKPCVTLREETEWVETLEHGWNHITGADGAKIAIALSQDPSAGQQDIYGSGDASTQIAQILTDLN